MSGDSRGTGPRADSAAPVFVIPDEFASRSHQHCAPLFLLRGKWPSLDDESATLTLVLHKGAVYGLTAYHVVRRAIEVRASPATVRNVIQKLEARGFIQPQATVPNGSRPDIGIHPLSPDFLERLCGKAASVSVHHSDAPSHGIAVGFPTRRRSALLLPIGGGFIESTGVHAVSEMSSWSESTFLCASALPDGANEEELSGMSGGPIFWTSEDDYILLGIITDAPTIVPGSSEPSEGSLGGGPRLIFRGERVTCGRLDEWLRDMPKSR